MRFPIRSIRIRLVRQATQNKAMKAPVSLMLIKRRNTKLIANSELEVDGRRAALEAEWEGNVQI